MIEQQVVCPVCGRNETKFCYFAHDILYKIVKDKFSIYKCSNCRASFIFPFPNQEETEKFYPNNYYSYKPKDEAKKNEGFFTRIKNNIIKHYMEPGYKFGFFDKLMILLFKGKFSGIPIYKKRNGTFLDIGCGPGNNLEILNRYGWDTYGIEIDERIVEYAKRRNLNVRKDSVESADFPSKKFDCIRIWHVFEHLINPHIALEKISQFLKDDGEILMAVPNGDSFASKFFGKYWYGLDVPRHVITYNPYTLNYLFEKYNLKCESIKYASCGSFIGSISNFFKSRFNFNGNLINNIFLVILFSPLDFISDKLNKGDTIFLKVVKKNE